MTTYYLPLINQQLEEQGKPGVVGLLEVLDWALVDGTLMAIEHSVSPSSSAATVYTLLLHFPAFNSTLEYDPSLNLGLLVGQQSNSGSPDIGLIVGATVGISVAVAILGLVITTGTVMGIIRVKRRHRKLTSLAQSVKE